MIWLLIGAYIWLMGLTLWAWVADKRTTKQAELAKEACEIMVELCAKQGGIGLRMDRLERAQGSEKLKVSMN
jgi:hypothetical protein